MIEGRCSIMYVDMPVTQHWWTQHFCAVPRAGEFVQGPESHLKGCVVSVTHCEDESGPFLGILLD